MSNSIGFFALGYETVEVFVDKGSFGGSFTFLPYKSNVPRIVIGLASDKWYEIVQVVLHEALEYALSRSRSRFTTTGDLSDDHSEYSFHFNHVILSHVTGVVARFWDDVEEKLRSEWDKIHVEAPKGGE